jgi:hypothetical protein
MALISLDIYVDRLDDVLAVFDRIEVHRSTAGSGGPFYEITDSSGQTAASMDGTGVAGFTLNGLTLEIAVDGATDQVTFTGSDPLNLATVLTQINAVWTGLASEVPTDTDEVRLTSPTVGTASSLLVTDNAAATELGFSTTKVNGKEARIPIVDPTANYNFKDLDGLATYFYKTRYSNTLSSTVSSFSEARQGSLDSVLSAGNLSKAKIFLTTGEGAPIVDRSIRFVPVDVNSITESDIYYLLPGTDGRVVTTTNEIGYAEIYLVRGATYRTHIEGSSYGREFVVPDQTEFDLLALMGTSPDPFDIVQAPAQPIKVTT